jgi:hypothetical protein
MYCHTPEISNDVPDTAKAFAGGKHYTFIRGDPLETSVNITPDPTTGIGSLTVDDIVSVLQTDTTPGGRKLCSTHPGSSQYLGGMTASDMHDIAVYITTLPPVVNGPFDCGETPAEGEGEGGAEGEGEGGAEGEGEGGQ